LRVITVTGLQHAGCGFATDDDADYRGKADDRGPAAIQSVVRRPGRAATMPIVCRDIGGEPTVANVTTARSADTHSTDSHAEPWLSSRHHPAPGGGRFHHNRRNRTLRRQRSGVSIEVSPNSPRSANSEADRQPDGKERVSGSSPEPALPERTHCGGRAAQPGSGRLIVAAC
jgi:hypothetical protein